MPKQPKQGRLFDPAKVTAQQFAPDNDVMSAAAAYSKSRGLDWVPPNNQQQVDHQRGYAQGQAYRSAMTAPSEAPGIRESYAAMREHINSQYEHMTKPAEQGGMGFTHEVTQHDPYDSPTSMSADIGQKRLKTMATEATGGHHFFTNEENDKFRAVHDLFGHSATGRGFSRHGEEAAYLSHRQMFPPEAHAALTSETRGQNSYLNYAGGEFPDQSPGTKLVGLPAWASATGKLKAPPPKSRAGRRTPQQGRLFE